MRSRQQTLRLCVDWSYELCTEEERQMWARLSLFAGGFELDAAEEFCAKPDSAAILDVLTALVDKPILIRETVDQTVRFHMLETLRLYGRKRLDESVEHTKLRRKYLVWHQKLTARAEVEFLTLRQAEWNNRLTRELPNIRDVMQYSLGSTPADLEIGLEIVTSLFPYWLFHGLFREARYWIAQFIDHREDKTSILGQCVQSRLHLCHDARGS
ncbi:putative ATPase [Rhodococcus sp. 27YEA15]